MANDKGKIFTVFIFATMVKKRKNFFPNGNLEHANCFNCFEKKAKNCFHFHF